MSFRIFISQLSRHFRFLSELWARDFDRASYNFHIFSFNLFILSYIHFHVLFFDFDYHESTDNARLPFNICHYDCKPAINFVFLYPICFTIQYLVQFFFFFTTYDNSVFFPQSMTRCENYSWPTCYYTMLENQQLHSFFFVELTIIIKLLFFSFDHTQHRHLCRPISFLSVGWYRIEEFYYFHIDPGVYDPSTSWPGDEITINTFSCFGLATIFALSEITLTLSLLTFFFAAPVVLFAYF